MKYDLELIQHVNLFEKKTHAMVKDCFFENGLLVFVVMPGQAKKAVGKNGVNVKKLSSMTNKKIKIVEFSDNPINFIRSFISPIESENIKLEENVIIIQSNSTKDKGILIGRNSKKLSDLKKITKKYYTEVKDIKIA